MFRPPIISEVNLNLESFVRSFKKLPNEIKEQAKKNIKALVDAQQMPARLHFHKLHGFDDIYTIHLCSDSTYKASFKIVDGVAIFRRAGKHDRIDSNP